MIHTYKYSVKHKTQIILTHVGSKKIKAILQNDITVYSETRITRKKTLLTFTFF